jgi:hypothetical protein
MSELVRIYNMLGRLNTISLTDKQTAHIEKAFEQIEKAIVSDLHERCAKRCT